ncbi:extracellular solute-binding protein [Sporosarcina sp. FSL K6-3457]|uniref:extracellular solute-binding protein n=1 Tax=Sporosarcina sp. FSL K6-3457 TaxID=2978204 RepID=UPI0030FCF97F
MKKVFLVISIGILFLCVFFLYSLKPENTIDQEIVDKDQITLWLYSPELIELTNQFEKESPTVKVITKLVKNPNTLVEELYAAQSAGNPPDYAEIPSWYGIFPLIESGAIIPVTDYLSPEYEAELPIAIKKRFQYADALWAMPISYEVPLLFVNEALLSQSKLTVDELDRLPAVFELSNNLLSTSPNHKLKWSMNADNLYPWYLMNIEAQSSVTTASALIEDNEAFLFHQNHLALTEFVNGEGGILLSSSNKLQLIEKLIGNKFKWQVMPFPIDADKLIPNGNGLVIFKKSEQPTDYMKQFLHYIQEDEQLKAFALASSAIPANRKLIQNKSYQSYYRHFPYYQKIVLESLEAHGRLLDSGDEAEWKQYIYANEHRE